MKDHSSILKILLHGFFLISANLFSIMAAVVIIQLTSFESNRLVQSSIALIINIITYLIVFKLMSGLQKDIMKIDNFSMFAIILIISLALLPSVFYPIHFLTHRDWGNIDNLLATWPFQFIVNGICLVLNLFILKSSR